MISGLNCDIFDTSSGALESSKSQNQMESTIMKKTILILTLLMMATGTTTAQETLAEIATEPEVTTDTSERHQQRRAIHKRPDRTFKQRSSTKPTVQKHQLKQRKLRKQRVARVANVRKMEMRTQQLKHRTAKLELRTEKVKARKARAFRNQKNRDRKARGLASAS